MHSTLRRFLTPLAIANLLFVAAAPAQAAIPSATGNISACFKKAPGIGVLRVIDREQGQSCLSVERLLEWQQKTSAVPSSLTMEAEPDAVIVLAPYVSRATVTVNAPKAGSVLVNAWTTITAAGLEGVAFSRLRNLTNDEASSGQGTSYKVYPSPIAVGWVFQVPAGQHTFSLDVSLSANITQFTNTTMTALFVPAEN